jgi:hypothetical protein
MLLLTRGTHSSHGRLPAAMAACQQVEIVLPAGAKSKPFPNFPQRGTPLIPGLLQRMEVGTGQLLATNKAAMSAEHTDTSILLFICATYKNK